MAKTGTKSCNVRSKLKSGVDSCDIQPPTNQGSTQGEDSSYFEITWPTPILFVFARVHVTGPGNYIILIFNFQVIYPSNYHDL